MKYLFLITFLSINLISLSQKIDSDTLKNNELYFTTQISLGSLGVQYKSEIKENTYLRFSLLDIFGERENRGAIMGPSFPRTTTNLNFRISFGIEKRRNITENFSLFYSINLIGEGGFLRYKTDNPALSEELRSMDYYYINPGLAFNSGAIFNIKNNFFLGVEISPSLVYKFESQEYLTGNGIEKLKTTGYDFSLNSNSLRILLVYAWNKRNKRNTQ